MSSIISVAELAKVEGMSSRAAALALGVSKDTVLRARAKLAADGEYFVRNGGQVEDGAAEFSPETEVIVGTGPDIPTTEVEVEAWLAARGFSEETHKISYSFGTWGADDRLQRSFKAWATPRSPEAEDGDTIDWAPATKRIEDFVYIPAKLEFLTDTAVIQPTDYQIGKTDFNGGTLETTERALRSLSKFADIVADRRPRNILMANTGDIIENFCNTAAQMHTNDLDLPHQIKHAFALELEAIKMLAPLTDNLVYATVPSNHGQWRNGGSRSVGDTHADWGIAIAEQVGIALELSSIDNVDVQMPDLHWESMTVEIGTNRIGLVHGHQQRNANMHQWWVSQTHGRGPTHDAQILMVGHFHSFDVYQSGNARWIMVGPTSDPGSSWWTNLKGESSQAGMLSYFVDNGKWDTLNIL